MGTGKSLCRDAARLILERLDPLRICLIAHDGRKDDMLEWAKWNRRLLSSAQIWATRQTGEMVTRVTALPIRLLLSGSHGGDAQVAAMVASGALDLVIFLWDPLAMQAHNADVQSLIRLAVLHNVAIACNRRSADLLISSRLWKELAERAS